MSRGVSYCDEHRIDVPVRENAAERGYDRRWRDARARYLSEHPLCAECTRRGRVTPARVVDHVVPHKGDQLLFWDETNWQSLCDYTSRYNCHGKKTASELGGATSGAATPGGR